MKIKDIIKSEYFKQTNTNDKCRVYDIYVPANGYIITLLGGDIESQIIYMYIDEKVNDVIVYTNKSHAYIPKSKLEDELKVKVYKHVKIL